MKIVNLGTSHGDPTLTANQTSHLIECGGKSYLLDCGEGCVASLIRRGVVPAQLSAVFVSHMHDDHAICLPLVIAQAQKYRRNFPDIRLQVHIPDQDAIPALRAWNAAMLSGKCDANNLYDLRVYGPEAPFDDGTLAVTPVPKGHLEGMLAEPEIYLPKQKFTVPPRSFCLVIRGEGKKIFFSGDLSPVKPALHDFPLEAAQDTDAVFIELVHYNFDVALPYFRQLRTKHLFFVHRGNRWQTPEGEQEALRACADLPYPVTMAHDGLETTI